MPVEHAGDDPELRGHPLDGVRAIGTRAPLHAAERLTDPISRERVVALRFREDSSDNTAHTDDRRVRFRPFRHPDPLSLTLLRLQLRCSECDDSDYVVKILCSSGSEPAPRSERSVRSEAGPAST